FYITLQLNYGIKVNGQYGDVKELKQSKQIFGFQFFDFNCYGYKNEVTQTCFIQFRDFKDIMNNFLRRSLEGMVRGRSSLAKMVQSQMGKNFGLTGFHTTIFNGSLRPKVDSVRRWYRQVIPKSPLVSFDDLQIIFLLPAAPIFPFCFFGTFFYVFNNTFLPSKLKRQKIKKEKWENRMLMRRIVRKCGLC
ncbi:hypothetical protein SNEBB_002214, partial [Seison nebaliae]